MRRVGWSAVEQARLRGLSPPFGGLVRAALVRLNAACDAVKIHPLVTSGRRDPEEQWALFARGRERRGDVWTIVEPTAVVTRATPRESPHCYGLALDVLLRDDHTRLVLRDDDPRWTLWGQAIDVSPLLEWGGSWRAIIDRPHCQLRAWWRHRRDAT
jgi:peptidoglycan L-alanyl-D-glutamate endopeptidase CwlK